MLRRAFLLCLAGAAGGCLSTGDAALASFDPQTAPFLGLWRFDAQTHAAAGGADENERTIGSALASSQLQIGFRADGLFMMTTTVPGEPPQVMQSRWKVERIDGNQYLIVFDNPTTPQEKANGKVRVVAKDMYHLEYYKQVEGQGASPAEDHVLYLVRAN